MPVLSVQPHIRRSENHLIRANCLIDDVVFLLFLTRVDVHLCLDLAFRSRSKQCKGSDVPANGRGKAKAKAKAKAEDQSWKEYAKASEDVSDPIIKERCTNRQRKDKRRSELAKKKGAKSVPL